jgi:hypothetical protein
MGSRAGHRLGNRVNRDYLVNASYAKSATSVQGRKSFLAVGALSKYSARYNMDFC